MQRRLVFSFRRFFDCLTLEGGTERLSRNVVRCHPGRVKIPTEVHFMCKVHFRLLLYCCSKQETGRVITWLQ
jgi:hypothetical protein